MSFTPLQKLAKNFKQFSSFDETLITGALSSTSLSEENINDLTNLTNQMIAFCKENNTAEHESETGKRTKKELFQLFLSKFKKDLPSYEHQETLDKFEVNVPEYLSIHNKLRSSFNIGEFESYLTTVNNMEGKLNRLYLLTISDRGYIWEKAKQDHQENNKYIPWKKLLNDTSLKRVKAIPGSWSQQTTTQNGKSSLQCFWQKFRRIASYNLGA